MTVIAGLIAARFGPVVGGLFLAFPAIFPASATLIEKHVRERKEKAGLAGARRGKEAAALDAVGAMLGSFGLAAFAAVIWLLIGRSPSLALLLATAAWLAVALLAWSCGAGSDEKDRAAYGSSPLAISPSERSKPWEIAGGNHHHRGMFDRTIAIPIPIDPDRIRAEYRDGVSRSSYRARNGRNRGRSVSA